MHKSTIKYDINIVKLIEKHRKLMKSSVTLDFFKNYYMDIKQICNENLKSFVWEKILKIKLIMHKVTKIFDTPEKFYSKCCKIF